MQMLRLFRPRKYRGQNKRNGFLKEFMEREEASKYLLFLVVLLHETVAGFLTEVFLRRESRNILFRHVQVFSVAL